jgi:hypothetical protein
VRVTDGLGVALTDVAEVDVSAPALGLTPATLDPDETGTPIDIMFASSGGTSPYTFTLVSTAVPGLSLSASGDLSGTPTAAGTYPVEIEATDSSGGSGPYSITETLSLVVYDALVLPAGSLPAATTGQAYHEALPPPPVAREPAARTRSSRARRPSA